MFGLDSWREQHGLSGGTANRDAEVVDELTANVGAYLMGRRMFSNGEGPWGDSPFEGPLGENPSFHVPVFVLTHHPREPLVKEGGTTFHFVTDGIESALAQARAAAGDKDVDIAGGASVIQQAINAGLLDQLQIHLVLILLGDGIRLFDRMDPEQIELERTRVIDSPTVTHLTFRVGKEKEPSPAGR